MCFITPELIKMAQRALFSDGWNSAAHFGFGFVIATLDSPLQTVIAMAYVVYQIDQGDKNGGVTVDIFEFVSGYALGKGYTMMQK